MLLEDLREVKFVVEACLRGNGFQRGTLGQEVFNGIDPQRHKGFHGRFPGQFAVFVGEGRCADVQVTGQIRDGDIFIQALLQMFSDLHCECRFVVESRLVTWSDNHAAVLLPRRVNPVDDLKEFGRYEPVGRFSPVGGIYRRFRKPLSGLSVWITVPTKTKLVLYMLYEIKILSAVEGNESGGQEGAGCREALPEACVRGVKMKVASPAGKPGVVPFANPESAAIHIRKVDNPEREYVGSGLGVGPEYMEAGSYDADPGEALCFMALKKVGLRRGRKCLIHDKALFNCHCSFIHQNCSCGNS